MNPNIHEAVDVIDAVTMLETPLPLTRAEVELVCRSLFEAGRTEGIKAEKARLHKIAEGMRRSHGTTLLSLAALLESWVDVDAFEETQAVAREEYEDPTTTIRRRLEEKARVRDSYDHSPDGPSWPQAYPYES